MKRRETFYTHRLDKKKGWIRTKRYRVRRKDGTIKDIQSYKRAHGQDIKRSSKAERKKRKR